MESSQIIDKFCSGPLSKFSKHGLHFYMQVVSNAEQLFADVFKIGVLKSFANFTRKLLESLLIYLQA